MLDRNLGNEEFSIKFYTNGVEALSVPLAQSTIPELEYLFGGAIQNGVTEIDALSLMYRESNTPCNLVVRDLTVEFESIGVVYPTAFSKNSEKATVTEL